MREVKRYDAVHIRYGENNIRYGKGLGVEMVTASDYDTLNAEAEALRAQRDKMAQILRDFFRQHNLPLRGAKKPAADLFSQQERNQ